METILLVKVLGCEIEHDENSRRINQPPIKHQRGRLNIACSTVYYQESRNLLGMPDDQRFHLSNM